MGRGKRETEKREGGLVEPRKRAGVGAQAESWGGGETELRRPASSTAFGLKTYLAGSPSFWGIGFSGEA